MIFDHRDVGHLLQRLVVFVVGREHDLAALAHRQRCREADLLGERDRCVERLLGLAQPADEAELVGALGRDRLAGEDGFHGGGATDRPRQTEQAAGAGDEVALHLGEPERRPSRGDHEVTGQDDLAASRGRQTVDCGDHRLVPLAVGEAGETTLLRRDAGARRGVDGLEVGTRAEDRTIAREGGRDHADPYLGVFFEAVERRLEISRDLAVDRVARFGPVQREDADASPCLVLDLRHGGAG